MALDADPNDPDEPDPPDCEIPAQVPFGAP